MKQRTELVSWRQVERNTQVEQLHEKETKKYEDILRELQDNMKCNSSWIIGIPEGEAKEQGIETLFGKIMTEKFLNLERERTMQIQEAQSPNQDELKEANSRTHHN